MRTGQFLLALVITLLGLLIFAGAYAGRAQVTACLVWGAISVVLTLLGISMLVDAIHPGALEPDTPEKRLGRLLDRAQALRATLPADSDDYRQLDTAVHGVENLMRQAVDQIRQGSTVDKSLVDVMIEFLSKAITAAGGKTD